MKERKDQLLLRAPAAGSVAPQRAAAAAEQQVDSSPLLLAQRRRIEGAFGPAVAQRRSFSTALTDTGVSAPGAYTEVAGGGTLAGGGAADLVVASGLQQSASLDRALNQAAGRAAEVGNKANEIRRTAPYAPAAGGMAGFAPFAGGVTPNALEPFIYRVKVPYRKGSKVQQIELDWQQAPAFRGYIVRQKDSGDTSASTISPAGVAAPHETGQVDTFNMAHANTGPQTLSANLEQDAGKTHETNEARIDARTKLAGEGARWLLVRTHSGKIADDSRIWTQANGKVYWVSFRTLWLNWLSVFDSTYDIPDSEVATKLVNDAGWTVPPEVVKRNRWAAKSIDIEVHR